MNLLKNKTWNVYCFLVSALLILVSFIIYLVNSTTGFYANTSFNSTPVVLSILSILILVALFCFADKLPAWSTKLILAVVVLFVSLSLCAYVNSKLTVFADVYFIPVNYPDSEKAACNQAITGIIFYIISLITLLVPAYTGSFRKEETAQA